MTEATKPRLEEHYGTWEVHPGYNQPIRVCIGAKRGSAVEVDKLYGPLAANPVRVWLDAQVGEWVVECEVGENWVEKARFDCQEGFDED